MRKKQSVKYWRDMREGEDYIYIPAKSDGAIVDIRMPTYNHGPYVRHAIESVLMQETKYPYRLFISDDHSTDDTQRIIREYQEKYPDKIAAILWNYNTGLTGHGCNGIVASRYCKAKYIATLEGDDYWTSPHKLENAVLFLEEHPEYIAYAHNINYVDEHEKPLHLNTMQYCVREEHIFTKRNVYDIQLISQTAAIVNRNYFLGWPESVWDEFYNCRANGDAKRSAILGVSGDVYYARNVMADYRKVFHGDSWTARSKGRNLSLIHYSHWSNIVKLIRKTYGVEIPFDKRAMEFLRSAKLKLLRKLSWENLRVYLRLFYLIRLKRSWKTDRYLAG